MTMLRVGGLLDVLTPLSDCEQQSVEKMNRIILGGSYMCGMDFHDGILYCGFLCARIILLYFSTLFCIYFVSSLFLFYGYHPRATTPHLYCKGYHAFTTARLPRLKIFIPASTPQFRVLFQGFHT